MELRYGVDKTDVVQFPLDLTGTVVRNAVRIAGLLYDARAAKHNPSFDSGQKGPLHGERAGEAYRAS